MKDNKGPIQLDEIKQIQIEMLIEFDKFCRSNNITYFLGWGSLLGAIRHKGYIPWDDDVDVIMPQSDLDKLINIFSSTKYKIATVDNEHNYIYPFPRFILKNTYRKSGLRAKEHGIFIDIYPISAYPLKASEMRVFLNKYNIICKIRRFWIKLNRLAFKCLPISTFPITKYLTKRQQTLLYSCDYDICNYVHTGDIKVPPYPKVLFEEKCEVEFEGHKFYAPKDWDTYLRLCYGDYMQLPPEDERHPYHGTDKYYWK